VLELRTYRDGGQDAVDVARQVAAFLGPAESTLELALYDIRLHDEAAELVKGALLGAHERGVAVRLLYNVNHSRTIPVPPPPRTAPELLEALPIGTRAVPGVPDLMHHKYVVRDRAAVWTGSMNWTQES
jgi:phosphatidylserine/phosphatidylglycerophosphate/cardiolipin synthase-like enzyme